MVSVILSRLVILVFGTLYPAYASYKAVRTKNVKEYVKWMMYWIVFALFCTVETFSDFLLSWFPFYYEFKIVFVLWLLSPITQGSSFLFRKFVHPQLARREKDIDELIDQTIKQGYSTFFDLGNKGIKVILKSVITGQSKLVDHLRHSYSTSDLTNDGHNIVPRHDAVGDQEEVKEFELDNRLIEDQAELAIGSTASLSKSRSSNSALSLSSVKEEDVEESDQMKTFTIPSSTRRHYSAREGTAKRQQRCQSLPLFSDKYVKPKVIASTSIESKRQFRDKFQSVEQKNITISQEPARLNPKGHALIRSLSHDSGSARWLNTTSSATTSPAPKVGRTGFRRSTEGSTFIKSDVSKTSALKNAPQISLFEHVPLQEEIETEIKEAVKDIELDLQDGTKKSLKHKTEGSMLIKSDISRKSASKSSSHSLSEQAPLQEEVQTETKQAVEDIQLDSQDSTKKSLRHNAEGSILIKSDISRKSASKSSSQTSLSEQAPLQEYIETEIKQAVKDVELDSQDSTKKSLKHNTEGPMLIKSDISRKSASKSSSQTSLSEQAPLQEEIETETKQVVKDKELYSQDSTKKSLRHNAEGSMLIKSDISRKSASQSSLSEKAPLQEGKQTVKDTELDSQDGTKNAHAALGIKLPSASASETLSSFSQHTAQIERAEVSTVPQVSENDPHSKDDPKFDLLTVENLGEDFSNLIFLNVDNDSDDQCPTPRAQDSPENMPQDEENASEKADPVKEEDVEEKYSTSKDSDTSSDVEFGSLDRLDSETWSEGSSSSLWETGSETSASDFTDSHRENKQVASVIKEEYGPWSAPSSPTSFIRGSKYEEDEIESWNTPSLLMSQKARSKDYSSWHRPELQKQKSFPTASTRSVLHSWPSPSQYSSSSATPYTKSSLPSPSRGYSFDPFQTWHPSSSPSTTSYRSLSDTSSPSSSLRTLPSLSDTPRRLYSRTSSLDVSGGESLYRTYRESAYATNSAYSKPYLGSGSLSTRSLTSSRTNSASSKPYLGSGLGSLSSRSLTSSRTNSTSSKPYLGSAISSQSTRSLTSSRTSNYSSKSYQSYLNKK